MGLYRVGPLHEKPKALGTQMIGTPAVDPALDALPSPQCEGFSLGFRVSGLGFRV